MTLPLPAFISSTLTTFSSFIHNRCHKWGLVCVLCRRESHVGTQLREFLNVRVLSLGFLVFNR
jgi:hypothetical protein